MTKSCYDKALELLARRAHSRFELQRKLAGRRYSPEEVEATLERVAGLGYLDDGQFARDFLRQRLARGPVGARRLRAELARRGVSTEDSQAALEELLPEDDREGAREAAAQWRRRSARSPSPSTSAALARFLERQGFSRRAIVSVLENEGEGDAELYD